MRGNGRDAPSAVIPTLAPEQGSSTRSGHCREEAATALWVKKFLPLDLGPMNSRELGARMPGEGSCEARPILGARSEFPYLRFLALTRPRASDAAIVRRLVLLLEAPAQSLRR